MAYGDPLAVATECADEIYCLRCAIWISRSVGDRRGNDFFFWLRDLAPEQREQIRAFQPGGKERDDFAVLVLDEEVIDWLSSRSDAHLMLLREGHGVEQELIIEVDGHFPVCWETFYDVGFDVEVRKYLHDAEEKRDQYAEDSLEEVVLSALIEGLEDVVGGYIPLERVTACFVDAMDNERLAVRPQRRIVGVDEESDTLRRKMYQEFIDDLKSIQKREEERKGSAK